MSDPLTIVGQRALDWLDEAGFTIERKGVQITRSEAHDILREIVRFDDESEFVGLCDEDIGYHECAPHQTAFLREVMSKARQLLEEDHSFVAVEGDGNVLLWEWSERRGERPE